MVIIKQANKCILSYLGNNEANEKRKFKDYLAKPSTSLALYIFC